MIDWSYHKQVIINFVITMFLLITSYINCLPHHKQIEIHIHNNIKIIARWNHHNEKVTIILGSICIKLADNFSHSE